MKAAVTWVVLANAGIVRVLMNNGTGKGFVPVTGLTFSAPAPIDYADEAGVMQSSAGPGRPSMTRADPASHAEQTFAKDIVARLTKAHQDGAFSRLILVAAPHMLGVIRGVMTPSLKGLVLAELDKDLTLTPADQLPNKLADLIAA